MNNSIFLESVRLRENLEFEHIFESSLNAYGELDIDSIDYRPDDRFEKDKKGFISLKKKSSEVYDLISNFEQLLSDFDKELKVPIIEKDKGEIDEETFKEDLWRRYRKYERDAYMIVFTFQNLEVIHSHITAKYPLYLSRGISKKFDSILLNLQEAVISVLEDFFSAIKTTFDDISIVHNSWDEPLTDDYLNAGTFFNRAKRLQKNDFIKMTNSSWKLSH